MKCKFFILLVACVGISRYASSGERFNRAACTHCCNKECVSPVTGKELPVAEAENMEFSPAGLLLLQI